MERCKSVTGNACVSQLVLVFVENSNVILNGTLHDDFLVHVGLHHS